ncbi:MAG TPA: type II toxin-antitoxin system RelE/ParE family toxin [Spirochaetales bacterium]|jgi:addiction module RelE/StbE family toxin|nr:type II toxin-antitoxin system RelE/ParE family toxin [Spirochaetales bacterium]
MFTVNYTGYAERDLLFILDYISDLLKSPVAAKNLLHEIEEHTKIIAENPFVFPLVRDEYLKKSGIRYIHVKNYFVFYTVEEDIHTITVIRIMYARRDWINLLKGETY